MNHSGAGHLKGMALITGGAFVVLLLLGRPAGEALLYAVLLSCPLMMVGMMFGRHGGHGGNDRAGHDDHPLSGSQAPGGQDHSGHGGPGTRLAAPAREAGTEGRCH